MTDRSFERANDASRTRLAALVERLASTQLRADLGEGWTVSSALAHMGFWDRWQAARWAEMLDGTWSAADDSVIAAEHLANEALHPYWQGVGAANVPVLALEAATELDALIARAPDTLVAALDGTPSAFLLHRHRHRDEHIDHIERTLAGARPAAPPADRSYEGRNETSLGRLRAVLTSLRPADLELAVGDGAWTVGQVLGHLAFWDRFLAARWRAAQAVGPAKQPISVPHEVADLLNDALPPTWAVFAGASGPAAIAETLAAAEAMNEIIASLPAEAPISTILSERPALLDRSIHRSEHLEVVEQALARAAG
jgi:uncharacterized damage-inducible protein DinB